MDVELSIVEQPTAPFDLPPLPPVPTAAERAADVIRNSIFEGRFRPGSALPETALAQALRVSRNTVREAFRTLMGEHLLSYTAHKGVTVRALNPDDVRDIYALRRMHELSAIRLIRQGVLTLDYADIQHALTDAQDATDTGDWAAAGTANLRFHARLVALHGSPRMNRFFQQLMTEMRLGFLALPDPRAFHEPYLARNAELCDDLAAGRFSEAHDALEEYLDDAMTEVVAAVQAATP